MFNEDHSRSIPTVMQEALPIKRSTKEKTKKSSSRQQVRLKPLLGDSCFLKSLVKSFPKNNAAF